MEDAPAITDSAKSGAKPEGKPGLKQRYKALLTEFGAIALVTWFTIFFVTWIGFATAIEAGWEFDGAAGAAGTWGFAYILTQLTKPIRFGLTLALTPLVAGAWRKLRPPKAEETQE
jgi:hypothetical protein